VPTAQHRLASYSLSKIPTKGSEEPGIGATIRPQVSGCTHKRPVGRSECRPGDLSAERCHSVAESDSLCGRSKVVSINSRRRS
jgi:hypothetical protein